MHGSQAQLAPRRLGGMVVVVVVQVLVGAILILGMTTGQIEKKLEDLKATVEKEKVEEKAPPPPPPDVVKPPPPFVPPPDIAIAVEAPPSNNAIATTSTPPPPRPAAPPAPPAPPPPAPTKLEQITRTHTKPPYPAISQRMGEQGTTELMVTINTKGDVIAAEVTKSSGSKRLDDAAIDHVKARWKWNPPTQNGQPVEARTAVRVVWSLLDAQ
jgi:protein TonB